MVRGMFLSLKPLQPGSLWSRLEGKIIAILSAVATKPEIKNRTAPPWTAYSSKIALRQARRKVLRISRSDQRPNGSQKIEHFLRPKKVHSIRTDICFSRPPAQCWELIWVAWQRYTVLLCNIERGGGGTAQKCNIWDGWKHRFWSDTWDV